MSGIRINTNIAALNAQRRLAETGSGLSVAAERLASGQRINRASDDAAGLAISSSLDARVRVLGQALRNLNDGTAVTNIAAAALNELKALTIRQRELAIQAANGIYNTEQRAALNAESLALTNEYNRIVSTTAFNGRSLLLNPEDPLVIQVDKSTISFGLGEALLREQTEVTGIEAGPFGLNEVGFMSIPAIPSLFPEDVTAGDLTGDGILDLVVADYTGRSTTIFVGNGDGSFAAGRSFETSGRPTEILLADLNHDAQTDVVAVESAAMSVRVLLGNGNGTVGAGISYRPGDLPMTGRIADVNGDSHGDIVTGLASGVSVMLGNGNGTFAGTRIFSTDWIYSLDLADINGDNKLDIVSAPYLGNAAYVLLGNGNGTYGNGQQLTPGGSALGAELTDVNGDNKADLLVLVESLNPKRVSVFLGNANGTFGARQTYQVGNDPRAMTMADLNADGHQDVLVALRASYGCGVLLANGNGTFKAETVYTTGARVESVEAADINGDGNLDVLTSELDGSTVSILFGRGGRNLGGRHG